MEESELQRENFGMAESRLENLPDDLLLHILSFLPTKCAVRTSILSKRLNSFWKSHWTSLSNLDFDDDETFSKTEAQGLAAGTSFADVVDKFLIRQNGSPIRNFRLSCRRRLRYKLQDVHRWICAAVDLNVEKLDLSMFLVPRISLPISLYNCKTLLVLKLMGNFREIGSLSVCLPSLKVLNMTLRPYSDDSFQRLLSGCPVLEELSLHGATYMRAFEICVPTLKKLNVEFINAGREDIKVEINTPSLETLSICDLNRRHYLIKNLDKVQEASLTLCKQLSYRDCIFKILNTLPSVQSLTLTHKTTKVRFFFKQANQFFSICYYCHMIEWISFAFSVQSLLGVARLDLPEFDKLVYLHFDLTSFNWRFLTSLLQKSPNLEVLVIQRTPCGAELDPTLRPSFSLGEESCWTEPSSVPVCLSSHLTKFKFRGYQGLEAAAELDFVRYVLDKSSVLDTVTIQPPMLLNLEQRHGLVINLCSLRRESKTCLEFEYKE
ncbi:hypothetical protein L6164_017842 [Bauhinia variegata]|uniref:Uncharacterized protein n=1 Tax=Bauhinia variegata TaxID=167791 RepID=A0ACB9N9D6_BAUVA|nr:hypothetical protein L6164_017842 [Bauhinia variegata]